MSNIGSSQNEQTSFSYSIPNQGVNSNQPLYLLFKNVPFMNNCKSINKTKRGQPQIACNIFYATVHLSYTYEKGVLLEINDFKWITSVFLSLIIQENL